MSQENDGFEFHRSLGQRVIGAIYRVVNFFVPWHKLPPVLGGFNLEAFREVLRERNLRHTGYGLPAAPPWSEANDRWRSADGSYNSLDHPRMGMAGTRFGRNVPLTEAIADPEPRLLDPNPRQISREILRRDVFKPATTLNLLAAAWIQFEVHDWLFHGKPIDENPFEILLSVGDDWPDSLANRMRIRRTPPDLTPREAWLGTTRTFRNLNSHWWDCAQLYGSSQSVQTQVRSGKDGKINLGSDGFLPDDEKHPGIDFTGFNDNWWIGLSLLHNLFAREHNSICNALKSRYPAWNDEELFQHARLINAALIAKIHTIEWTPGILGHPTLHFAMNTNWSGVPFRVLRAVLGKNSETGNGIPGSSTEQHSAPYAITEEFVSVYRLHPLIPDSLKVRSLNHSRRDETYEFLNVQGSFSRGLLVKHGIADLLYSFGLANPGAITVRNYPDFLRHLKKKDEPLMDMASVDIMRDRERGVPRYNRFRELIGKPRINTFEELTSIPGMAARLREVYKSRIDDVDLLVGLLSEDLPKGFGFSDTAFRIFILMASRRLKSDRFFTVDYRPAIYTQLGMDWIANNSMKSVLLRHVPELGRALEGIANPFAPWKDLSEVSPAALLADTGLTWTFRKGFWNWLGKFKFRSNRPAVIPVPTNDGRQIEAVPLNSMVPAIPIENILVADRVPADEAQPLKELFYRFQLLMYRLFPAMQSGLPPIDAHPAVALAGAYTAGHRKLFPAPNRPPELDGPDDALLATLAVQGPFACYLERAPDGGFQWDLRELGRHEHYAGLHTLGVRVLFDVDVAAHALRPRSIESTLGVHRPDDSDWPVAVRLALCAASTNVSLIRHFCWVHLTAGAALAMATRNCLPSAHPIRRLLWPHVFGTQYSNAIVTKGQMVHGGDFPDIFSLTDKGMCSLFSASYSAFRLSVFDPAADAVRRGIAGVGFETTSQNNLQVLFDVMHAHATRYVDAYYPADAEITGDPRLMAWLNALDRLIPNGVDEIVSKPLRHTGVARLVAAFIYMASVQHEVLGAGVWNYQLWTDRIPARMYRDGRREPLDVYQRLVNANFNLRVHRARLMQDFSYLALDQRGRELFARFLHELRVLDDSLAAQAQELWLIRPSILEANINA
jgi:heme peroxidase/lipoxygenase